MLESPVWDLAADEVLLWTGRPRTGLLLRPSDAYVIPCSALALAGGIVFFRIPIHDETARAFYLFGFVFFTSAIYQLVGRFFVDAWRRSRLAYAVTSQRILVSGGAQAPWLTSLELTALREILVHESPGGAGTITFGHPAIWEFCYEGSLWPDVNRRIRFEMINDVKSVYEIIRTAQRNQLTQVRDPRHHPFANAP